MSYFAAEISQVFGFVGDWVSILDQRVDLHDNLQSLERTQDQGLSHYDR